MISIVIPTQRAQATINVLSTIRKMPEDTEIIVVVDAREDVAAAISQAQMGAKVLFYPEALGAIECWNRGLAASRGDILVFGADDLVFAENSLAEALRAHYEKLGAYGLVGFNDLHQDGNNLSTHFLYDRKFCKEVLGGVMAYPHYQFYCNDTEANARAKASGHFYWCPESVVDHRHYSYGLRPADDIDARYQDVLHPDLRVFAQRKQDGFPNDFPAVI